MVTRKQAQDAYDAGKPIMSDSEFDERFAENSGYLGAPGKVMHHVPMLSQQKCHDLDEVKKFIKKMSDKGENNFWASLKLDGFACSLEYINGEFTRASTRGDGQSGEDITAAVRAYVRPPEHINCSHNIEIRGEVILPISQVKGDTEVNYRNIATGMCKRKKVTKSDVKLEFYAYDVLGEPMNTASDKERMTFVENLGFNVVPLTFFSEWMSIDLVMSGMNGARLAFDGVCDGVVIKCASYITKLRVGFTDHHPKYSIAYKFETKSVESTVFDIEITTGKTGKRTPVARIKPVNIDGAMVYYVSLGSEAVMEKMQIKPGSNVLVTRSGGVIPKIVKVLS